MLIALSSSCRTIFQLTWSHVVYTKPSTSRVAFGTTCSKAFPTDDDDDDDNTKGIKATKRFRFVFSSGSTVTYRVREPHGLWIENRVRQLLEPRCCGIRQLVRACSFLYSKTKKTKQKKSIPNWNGKKIIQDAQCTAGLTAGKLREAFRNARE